MFKLLKPPKQAELLGVSKGPYSLYMPVFTDREPGLGTFDEVMDFTREKAENNVYDPDGDRSMGHPMKVADGWVFSVWYHSRKV